MSVSEFIPVGFVEPVSWRKSKWRRVAANTTKGSKKWKVKKRVSVALSTEKPPQIHWTKVFPM